MLFHLHIRRITLLARNIVRRIKVDGVTLLDRQDQIDSALSSDRCSSTHQSANLSDRLGHILRLKLAIYLPLLSILMASADGACREHAIVGGLTKEDRMISALSPRQRGRVHPDSFVVEEI